jgi:hypothetical protein
VAESGKSFLRRSAKLPSIANVWGMLKEFLALKEQVASVIQKREMQRSTAGLPVCLEATYEKELDCLNDELYALCWSATSSKAASKVELIAKAMMLMDRVEDDPQDLISCLTRSVCADILHMLATIQPPAK